jgi:hypothetical protein
MAERREKERGEKGRQEKQKTNLTGREERRKEGE